MEPIAPPGVEGPSHRACAHCRSQKIRCIPDDANPDICQRCARSGRACVFTPLQKRKQRKRTDTRVAELEKEMRTMRAMLKNKEQAGKTAGSKSAATTTSHELDKSTTSPEAPDKATAASQDLSSLTKAFSGMQHQDQDRGEEGEHPLELQGWPTQLTDWPRKDDRDIVDRGVISMSKATQLVDRYKHSLFPHFPGVLLPESLSADDLRVKHPTLFLSVVAAAAARDDSQLSVMLDQEILYAYADRSMIRSEKSLELVQAMLLSATWYHPPQRFGQLKYYEYIHMACAMAMDIGIGTRPSIHRGRFGQSHSGRQSRSLPVHPVHYLEDASNPDLSMSSRVLTEATPDTASVESRRTLLACYIIAACVSMSLRRPHMLRVNSYIRSCVEGFETSSDALPSDKLLVTWARLTIIAEEISLSFCFDDPGSVGSITDLGVQLMLKDYSKRLSDWFASVPKANMGSALAIQYWSIRLYLHEIALHVDHSPEDFIAPYQMGTIFPWQGPEIPTQVLVRGLAECIEGSHQLLDVLFGVGPEDARAMPVFCYVRICFASFILAKLCLSAAHPESVIGKVIDRESIKADTYVDKAILHMRNVIGSTKARVPAVFLAILFKLRQWCLHPEHITVTDKVNDYRSEARTLWQEALEEPRVSELTSSPGNTPHSSSTNTTRNETQAGSVSFEESGAQDSRSNDLAQQAASFDPASISTGFAQSASDLDKSFSVPDPTAQGQAPWYDFGDQMQLDPGFYQFFTEVNSMPNGGLTGLGDLQSLPNEFLGMPDFGWPNASNNDNNYAKGP